MALTDSYASTTTTTPQFYTDYLNNVASRATTGANTAQYVGASPLQQQAFTAGAANVGNYQPDYTKAGTAYGTAAGTNISGATQPYLANTAVSGLSQANPYLTAGTSSAAPLISDYMNPYTSSVVDQIRLANQQNIAQNLSPAITSGAVGSGQFGSARGANALALGISNANIGALGLQNQALQTGYASALAAAQQQRANQLNAGQTAGTLQNNYNQNQATAAQVAGNAANQQAANQIAAGTGMLNLGTQTQQAGLADVSNLSQLGGQQQAIAQNQQYFPLDVAGKQMAAMSGAQIPTTQTQTATGSPLSLISGLSSIGIGLYKPYTDAAGKVTTIADQIGLGSLTSGAKTAIGGAYDWAKNAFGGTNAGTSAATSTTGSMGDTGANVRGGSGFGGTGSGIQDPNATSGSSYSPTTNYGAVDINGNQIDPTANTNQMGYWDYSDPQNPVWIST
jgi:hypothetical protein